MTDWGAIPDARYRRVTLRFAGMATFGLGLYLVVMALIGYADSRAATPTPRLAPLEVYPSVDMDGPSDEVARFFRWHDAEKSVTCWTAISHGYNSGGVSLACIPDWQLVAPAVGK